MNVGLAELNDDGDNQSQSWCEQQILRVAIYLPQVIQRKYMIGGAFMLFIKSQVSSIQDQEEGFLELFRLAEDAEASKLSSLPHDAQTDIKCAAKILHRQLSDRCQSCEPLNHELKRFWHSHLHAHGFNSTANL